MKFCLPPFAKWSPQDWQSKGGVALKSKPSNWVGTSPILGSGDFKRVGLFLFTVQNQTWNCEAEREDLR